MPYDTEPLTVPQPTYSGGSAVQTATDPSGQKWQFDNEGGNWVNLSTGESVSPKVFSQMAGRSGDTAANTMQLADAMRREEASLTEPRMSAPITPPMTGTTPPPMASPIRAPQGTPIMPPADVARVAAQQPVPSTATPPSPEANKFYIMQLIQRGALTPKDAVLLYPQFFQQPSSKPMTDYQKAQVERWSQPKTITPFQESQIARWKQQDADKQQAALRRQVAKIQSDIDKGNVTAAEGKKQIDILTGGGITAVTPPAPTAAPGKNEVRRKTKDGRWAIFDSKTKKFVRWDNDNEQ